MHHFLKSIGKEFKKHAFDYLLFISVGICFLIALNIFRGERLIELILVVSFISFYIIWGIYHHIVENTLHLKVVMEYILIGFTLLFLLKIVILP
ncbi:MAG: hypothetical protein ACEQSA_05230 [Weeksellaceae bacterium]